MLIDFKSLLETNRRYENEVMAHGRDLEVLNNLKEEIHSGKEIINQLRMDLAARQQLESNEEVLKR